MKTSSLFHRLLASLLVLALTFFPLSGAFSGVNFHTAIPSKTIIRNRTPKLVRSECSLIHPASRSRVCRAETRLFFDILGVGPTEVLVVAVAGAVLFGPEQAFRSIRGDTSSPEETDTSKRMKLMKEDAKRQRNKRAWDRINAAIEDEDPWVTERLSQLGDEDMT